ASREEEAPQAHRRRHRAHRHVRLRPHAAPAGRRPHRADRRDRPPAVRPERARLDEDGVPPGRRPRRGGARGGVRRRRRRRAPRVPHHRRRVARDDPRDQRRGHAEHVPRRGRRGRRALRLRLVGGRLRLPRRQPRRDDRGLAGAPGRSALLRAGEGGDRGAAARRGVPAPRARALPPAAADRARAAHHRGQAGPPRAARRARQGARPRLHAPARAGPRGGARPAAAVHPRGGRRTGVPALHRRRRRPGHLQHHRRRRAVGHRRRARAQRHPDPVPRRPGAGGGARGLVAAAAVVRAAGDRVGRGAQPPGDHGREQGQGRARLEPALHEHRGAARHDL
ncbi:MAG: NAD-dependent epimerase/dehydratase, partial [uncultured Solirubrobacteraceae bacterium]